MGYLVNLVEWVNLKCCRSVAIFVAWLPRSIFIVIQYSLFTQARYYHAPPHFGSRSFSDVYFVRHLVLVLKWWQWTMVTGWKLLCPPWAKRKTLFLLLLLLTHFLSSGSRGTKGRHRFCCSRPLVILAELLSSTSFFEIMSMAPSTCFFDARFIKSFGLRMPDFTLPESGCSNGEDSCFSMKWIRKEILAGSNECVVGSSSVSIIATRPSSS